MFKERAPSTHHATNATWSKRVALITQWARIGSPNCPGILEVITDWPEGKDFRILPEEEVTRAEEVPPYNKLTEDEKPYPLFTDGSCHIVGKHRRSKAAVWSPTQRVAEAAEGQGELSQFAEVKAIQLALDIAEGEKWPTLYLCTNLWMVASALWGWLQQWKQSNWQCRGKPIWAAPLWQYIAARLEKLVVKVHHVDAHVPKSRATEEHQNNQQVDQAAKIEVAQTAETTQSDTSVSSGETSKRSIHFLPNEIKLDPQLENKDLNTKEKSDPGVDEDDVEGDSFFDDPIPKPERTYGWKTEANKAGGLASLSDAPPLKNLNRNSVLKDLRLVNAKLGSLELGTGDDDEYADDFNSTSHRSEKSDISIGEEIDEISVETEESNASDKLEGITQDLTISHLSDVADYLEDVA
ncbi:hypothetical protein GRJ2_001163400 [Grus japonensis]|uniref:RNase H type-1 domain-containing protein n=1 Tax=Grus japonensis TaxID=30415 RepID=A0ABC9WP62_GRUJA